MKNNTKKLVTAALLSALIIILQLIAGNIRIGPASITLALAPILVGIGLYGIGMGAFLGFVFSVAVLIDPATQVFFAANALMTVVIVIAKGTVSGYLAACAYKALAKKSELAGVIAAGIVMPIINTWIFVLGASFFFLEVFGIDPATTSGFAAVIPIVSMIIVNFVVELAVNLLLSTSLVTAIKATRKL